MADRIVVMDFGEIQQIGSPQEVYRRPGNNFVAEFVGTNNIFRGRVSAVDTDRVTVATPTGTYSVESHDGKRPSIGDEVTFVICADRIVTSFEGEPRENQVTGTLRGQEFVGAVVTFFLELEDGSEFRIQKQESQSRQIVTKLGETLAASWESGEAFLLTGGE
jgi:spermidine/putrescine transport system ATP-binding protein